MLPLSALGLSHLRGSCGQGCGLRILSWNVATLFYHITANPAAASMKMKELKRLARLHHIVCLQEVHGVCEDKHTFDTTPLATKRPRKTSRARQSTRCAHTQHSFLVEESISTFTMKSVFSFRIQACLRRQGLARGDSRRSVRKLSSAPKTQITNLSDLVPWVRPKQSVVLVAARLQINVCARQGPMPPRGSNATNKGSDTSKSSYT